MALPTAGNGIRAEAQILPSSSLTDFTLLVDLAQIPAARLTHLFNDINTTDGTRGRVSNLSNIELPFDWNCLIDQSEPGFIRIKYTGTLPTTGTVGVIIYAANTRNTAYAVSDTYGQYNAYDTNYDLYIPAGGGADRTVNQRTAVPISAGNPTVGGVPGKYCVATSYDGIDDRCVTVDFDNTAITALVWSYDDGVSQNEYLFDKGFGDSYLQNRSSFFTDSSGSNNGVPYQTWAQVGGTFSGTTRRAYLNGVNTNTSTSATMGTNNNNLTIGSNTGGGSRFSGLLQEFQIHKIDRGGVWISEEYAQSNDNSTFWGNWSDITLGGNIPTLYYNTLLQGGI